MLTVANETLNWAAICTLVMLRYPFVLLGRYVRRCLDCIIQNQARQMRSCPIPNSSNDCSAAVMAVEINHDLLAGSLTIAATSADAG